MSRTQRFIDGVAWGHINLIVVTAAALWITPFLLRHLGQRDFGLWLIATQLLGYLALSDFGVVTLLSREVAYTIGREGGTRNAAGIGEVVDQIWSITWWQLPFVAVAALAMWMLMPAQWVLLKQPLLILLAVFVCLFPLRIFHAVLLGVQDFGFAIKAQLGAWCIGTCITVSLVWYGLGLHALSIGWAASQFLSAVVAWYRLRRQFSHVLPRLVPRWSRPVLGDRLTQSFWVSVAQVAQVFLGGTDVLIVGFLLGPAAVVPYVCTGKLITVLANQPHLLLETARPALSELKTGSSAQRLRHITTALSLAVLVLSSLTACLVLAVNQGFVGWWVGAEYYGGSFLTVAFVIAAVTRHWNSTLVHALFCFGYERRISLTTLLDGCVTIAGAVILTWLIGPAGAVIASIAGAAMVSLPLNLFALSHETGTSVNAMVAPLSVWFWRAALLCAAAVLSASIWVPGRILPLVATAAVIVVVHLAVMFLALRRSPLRTYFESGFSDIYLRRFKWATAR